MRAQHVLCYNGWYEIQDEISLSKILLDFFCGGGGILSHVNVFPCPLVKYIFSFRIETLDICYDQGHIKQRVIFYCSSVRGVTRVCTRIYL